MNKIMMNKNLILLLNLLLLLQLNSISAVSVPPQSILLFNCSKITSSVHTTHHLIQNCSTELETRAGSGPCLVVADSEKFSEMGFHPLDLLGCSHYLLPPPLHPRRRVSVEVPDRVKNLCDQCGGNCGAGLKCLCHPQLCRDKVVYGGGRKMGASGGSLLVLSFIVVWLLVLVV